MLTLGRVFHRVAVQVDLRSLTQRQLGRLEWCFSHTMKGGHPMILSYSDPATGKSKKLDLPKASNPKVVPLEVSLETEIVRAPPFECLHSGEIPANKSGSGRSALLSSVEAAIEWVGAAACGAARIRVGDDAGDSVSTYCVPQPPSPPHECEPPRKRLKKGKRDATPRPVERPTVSVTKLVRWTVTGLMPPELVKALIDRVHSDETYASVSTDIFFFLVHGFQDSPVSWSGREKGYRTSGDNMLGVAIRRNGDCLSWQYRAEHDDYGG